MRKIITLTLCIALAAVFLTGCVTINFNPFGGGSGITGRGSLETFTFDVGEITEVRVELLANIVYYSAPSNTVTFEVQPNLMEHISVEESGAVSTATSEGTLDEHPANNAIVRIISKYIKDFFIEHIPFVSFQMLSKPDLLDSLAIHLICTARTTVPF